MLFPFLIPVKLPASTTSTPMNAWRRSRVVASLNRWQECRVDPDPGLSRTTAFHERAGPTRTSVEPAAIACGRSPDRSSRPAGYRAASAI